MVDCLIAITTFKKADAASVLQKSLLDHDYGKYSFFWGDDFNGEVIPDLEYSAVDKFKEFQSQCKINMQYGPRGGVAVNKNRCINFFLKHSKADYLLLLDDDLVFHRSGLIDELVELSKECNLSHITGMWIDPPSAERKLGADGQYWEQSFPVKAYGDIKGRITYHASRDGKMPGSHGNAGFYSRDIIEKIGFYPLLGGAMYGFEHALHTSRAMKAQNPNRSPLWHPQHHHAWKYYHGQAIPNRYGGTEEEIKKAEPLFFQGLTECYLGRNLLSIESGLTEQEVLL